MTVTIITPVNAVFAIVSYCISVVGAFTTFQFVYETKFTVKIWKKLFLIMCASISMGFCAIWAMHFIGTLCYSFVQVEQTIDETGKLMTKHTPLQVQYDLGITFVSAVVAVILCFVGFLVSTLQQFSPVFRKYICCSYFTKHDLALELEQDSSIKEEAQAGLAELIEMATAGSQKQMQKAEKTPTPVPKLTLRERLPSRSLVRSYFYGSPLKPHIIQLVISSLFNSAGVVTMHYLGMLATHVEKTKMVYNPGLVVLACIIAFVASFAAFWISFNLDTHFFKVISSFLAACAVGGMHYTGMASATYIPSATNHNAQLFATSISNTDLAMGTTIATSAACFFLLVMVTAARNVLSRTINQLKLEKKVVEKFSSQLQKTLVQMNSLLNQVAFEEHQIRKVMDCLTDPVCVADEHGNIMKANKKFKTITAITAESKHNVKEFFPELEDTKTLFFSKEDGSRLQAVKLTLEMKSLFQKSTVMVEVFEERHVIQEQTAVERAFYVWIIQKESIPYNYSRKSLMTFADEDSSFDTDMENTEFVTKFKKFCDEEHSSEGLIFLDRVKQYKSCESTMERIELQKSIATDFLTVDSPYELNLSKQTIHENMERIARAYGQPDLFDELCKQVKHLLLHSYTRFRLQSSRPASLINMNGSLPVEPPTTREEV